MRQLRSVTGLFVLVGLLGLSALLVARLNVDSVATKLIQSELDDTFADTGYSAQLRSATYIDGVGFELRGLRVIDDQARQSLLEIQSIVVGLPTGLTEWVDLDIQPTSVQIDGTTLLIPVTRFQQTVDRIAALLRRRPSRFRLVPVKVRNSNLRFVAPSGRQLTQLTNVGIDFTPANDQDSGIHRLVCQMGGDHVRKLSATVHWSTASKRWQTQIDHVGATIDNSLLAILPKRLQQLVQPIAGIQANVEARGTVQGGFSTTIEPEFNFEGTVTRLSLRDSNLALPIHNCTTEFAIDNAGFNIKRATGQIGDGHFQLSYRQQGLRQRKQWAGSGAIHNFQLDAILHGNLPNVCTRFCNDFSPSGVMDVQFSLDSSGHKDISAKLKDMSFSFYRFPYRVDHCVGDARWLNDKITFAVKANENNQQVSFDGHVNNPGDMATYVFNFGTDGRLPINEKLLGSMQNYPSTDRAIRDFRAAGLVSGRGTIKKLKPGSTEVLKDVRIQLHECSVFHKSFEYPLHHVEGNVHVTHDRFSFNEITGVNSLTEAMCNGTWTPTDGLDLLFICSKVGLDNRLRHALTPELRGIWDGIRPSGLLRFGKVLLKYMPGKIPLDIRVQANLGSQTEQDQTATASIHPIWFPYRLGQLKGDIEVGDGRVALRNIIGKHGPTWLTCHGTGHYSDDDWSLSLENVLAGSVVLDEDLLQALPVDLSTAIRQLDYQGQLNVSGEISFSGDQSEIQPSVPSSPVVQASYLEAEEIAANVNWDLRLDMDQGKLMVGIPLNNVFGSVRLNGEYKDKHAGCRGDISVDSLTLYGMQITNIQGPLWIDNNQTLAGKFARTSTDAAPLRGEVFGGEVSFDGWIGHQDLFPFYVQSSLESSKLEAVAAELAPDIEELSGDSYGFLRLQGDAAHPHSYTGSGNVHLRDAKIHQLPIILSLLKIISIKELTRNAFDSSNIDFSIKGDLIKLDRIELIGDAVSLIGNGYFELMRHADINFYSVVGRNRIYIPVVSDLYRASSQRILWINIGGPLEDLQTSRRVLPGLNDSIRTLFQSSGNPRFATPNSESRRPSSELDISTFNPR